MSDSDQPAGHADAPADVAGDASESASAGYSTAELLGNAALAVGALVAIWAALQGLGENVVDWIASQLMGG
jgi:hypothetical protein